MQSRAMAMAALMEQLTDQPVIICNGFPSREAQKIADRPTHFYMIGSMGSAAAIGLGVALAESAQTVGARIDLDSDLRPEFLLFHEGPSRILISTEDVAGVQGIAAAHGVEAPRIGVTIGEWVEVSNRNSSLLRCSVSRLRELRETSLGRLLHAR